MIRGHSTSHLYWVRERCLSDTFPPVEDALEDPDGLLAIGGELSPARLVEAYQSGIFPWYSEGQPYLWWSPSERAVLHPSSVKVSRSLAKSIRNRGYKLSFDKAFSEVIAACAQAREAHGGTWITQEMRAAYIALHASGQTHSVECWLNGRLVGGLYGVALGRVFFGESMFSHERDASKVAFVALCRMLNSWSYQMLDCQMPTPHLSSLGAQPATRHAYMQVLRREVSTEPAATAWRGDNNVFLTDPGPVNVQP